MKNKIFVALILALFSINIWFLDLAEAQKRWNTSRSASPKVKIVSGTKKPPKNIPKLDTKTQRKVDAKKKRNTDKLAAAKKKKDGVVKKQTATLNSLKSKTKNWSSSDYAKNSDDLKNKLRSKWYDDTKINSYRSSFNSSYPSYSGLSFWDYFFLYWLFSGSHTELTSASNSVSAYKDSWTITDDTYENIANEITGTQFSKADLSDLIPAINEILLAHKASYMVHKSNYSVFTMNSNFYKINSSIVKLDETTSIYKVSSIKKLDKLAAVPLMLEWNSYTNNDMVKRLMKSFLSEMHITNGSKTLFNSATCSISNWVTCEVVEDWIVFDTKYVVKGNLVSSVDKTRLILKNVTAYKK